jgi:hypothetical protein
MTRLPQMLAVATIVALVASTTTAAPQRRFGRFFNAQPTSSPWMYDGAFVFCRIAFRQSTTGDGGGWSVDYPRADLNYPFRLRELTSTPVSRGANGEPNHVVVTLTDPHLFQCPFVMLTEPGGAFIGDDEAVKLREYLTKGGFLWADDFWGEYAWSAWEEQLRKALPAAEYPIRDLPLSHPLFHTRYPIDEIPQIPSINFWLGTGGQTSERVDSQTPHVRAAFDPHGRIVALMTHNTDFGDAFEREGDNRAYFDRFAAVGYAFGVNVYVYAMTH